MKTFTFSENWNKKLYGSFFTTIRLDKGDCKVGDVVHVVFVKEKIIEFDANVVSVQRLFFDEIPDNVLMLDTGYNRQGAVTIFKRFYGDEIKTKKMAVILLNRVSDYLIKDK